MCGEKTWTGYDGPFRPTRHLPQLIEVKAPAEPDPTEKTEPKSAPKPEAPMIEASVKRETLPTPGFTLVTLARQDLLPLPGDGALSMVAMTGATH